ncbi:MAG: MFS transporter [Pseudomonadota bacterium]|nr:MFS transporter [Pseudomonadota bacterium]
MKINKEISSTPGATVFIALVLIAFLGPLSIHLFIPVLPFIRMAFSVSESEAQLAFSLAILSMALATPVYGTLSDRFGRLPVVIGGIGMFTLGSVVATFAPSIIILIIGRIIQGAGAACGLVLSRAIASDVYGPDRLGKMIAYLTAALVLGPMFGPPLGGLLTDFWGWQFNLIVPAIFGVIAVIVAVNTIGETKPPNLKPSLNIFWDYRLLLCNRKFLFLALNPAIASGTFFSLNAAAVYLMVETLGRPATEFGLYFMFGPVGYMAGNYLAGLCSNRFSPALFIIFGSIVSLIGSLTLPWFIAIYGLIPLSLFLPSLILSFGQGFSNPYAQAEAIAINETLAGTASGIVVFLYLVIVAAMTQLVALAPPGSVTFLIYLMISSGILALALGVAGIICPSELEKNDS